MTLGGKYPIDTHLAKVGRSYEEGCDQDHCHEHCYLGEQHCSQEFPVHRCEMQLTHALEEHGWHSKLGDKDSQSLALALRDQADPARQVAKHNDGKALKQCWQQVVEGIVSHGLARFIILLTTVVVSWHKHDVLPASSSATICLVT